VKPSVDDDEVKVLLRDRDRNTVIRAIMDAGIKKANRDAVLRPGEVIVGVCIATYLSNGSAQAWPGTTLIQTHTGVSVSGVRRATKALVEADLFRIVVKRAGGPGKAGNIYGLGEAAIRAILKADPKAPIGKSSCVTGTGVIGDSGYNQTGTIHETGSDPTGVTGDPGHEHTGITSGDSPVSPVRPKIVSQISSPKEGRGEDFETVERHSADKKRRQAEMIMSLSGGRETADARHGDVKALAALLRAFRMNLENAQFTASEALKHRSFDECKALLAKAHAHQWTRERVQSEFLSEATAPDLPVVTKPKAIEQIHSTGTVVDETVKKDRAARVAGIRQRLAVGE
jgi:hypothetical protein